MPLGGTAPGKQVPHWAGNFLWAFLSALFKVLFRYRVDCRESLRAFDGKSGVVVVANHNVVSGRGVHVPWRRAPRSGWRFMGRESLFDNAHGLVGQILSRVGAFPVKRGEADRTSIKRAARMLKNNEVVGILPEGTRRNKGSLVPEIHSGAAFVAKMGHAPILPMTVRNAEYVKQKGQVLPLPQDNHRVRGPRPGRRLRLPPEGGPPGGLHVVRHARVLRALAARASRAGGHARAVPERARLHRDVRRAPPSPRTPRPRWRPRRPRRRRPRRRAALRREAAPQSRRRAAWQTRRAMLCPPRRRAALMRPEGRAHEGGPCEARRRVLRGAAGARHGLRGHSTLR